jgi:hypothetical protein
MAERLSKSPGGLVAETLASAARPVARTSGDAPAGRRAGDVLMNFGGLSRERVRRSMELFAREVMPRFK